MSYRIEAREQEFEGVVEEWAELDPEAREENDLPETYASRYEADSAVTILEDIYPIHEFHVVPAWFKGFRVVEQN